MSLSILFIAIIFLAAFYYLAQPFLTSKRIEKFAFQSPDQKEDLLLKKNEIISCIKDIEFDHQLKKISDEDFKQLYQETFNEGTEILRNLDKIQDLAPLKDKEPILTKPDPNGKKEIKREEQETENRKKKEFCPHCGESLVVEANFCAYCGTQIN